MTIFPTFPDQEAKLLLDLESIESAIKFAQDNGYSISEYPLYKTEMTCCPLGAINILFGKSEFQDRFPEPNEDQEEFINGFDNGLVYRMLTKYLESYHAGRYLRFKYCEL